MRRFARRTPAPPRSHRGRWRRRREAGIYACGQSLPWIQDNAQLGEHPFRLRPIIETSRSGDKGDYAAAEQLERFAEQLAERLIERGALRRDVALAGLVGPVFVAQPDGRPCRPVLQPERVQDRELRRCGARPLKWTRSWISCTFCRPRSDRLIGSSVALATATFVIVTFRGAAGCEPWHRRQPDSETARRRVGWRYSQTRS